MKKIAIVVAVLFVCYGIVGMNAHKVGTTTINAATKSLSEREKAAGL